MLSFDAVTLRVGGRILFSDASFVIHRGFKLGLVGANGVGKSSLLRLIRQELEPDAGEVKLVPNLVVAHVAQEMPAGTRAAIEHVLDGDEEFRLLQREIETHDDSHSDRVANLQLRFEAIGGYSMRARAARLMNGLGFSAGDEERPLNEFSGGWRMRLNLAQALMCRSDLLLLDEPTNHLDLEAVIWLQDWLGQYPGTLILISHDRDFLDSIADHVLSIENNAAEMFTGNYSDFELRRAEMFAQRQAEAAKQQREVARIQSFVDRFRAKATKAKQAQSRLKTLARMSLIAQAHVDSPLDFAFAEPVKLPSPLLRSDDASVVLGGKTILRDVRLGLMPGDRFAILGPNGAGKSTLMKLLAGHYQPDSGTCIAAPDASIGYFAQHSLEQLRSDRTAIEHLADVDPSALERDLRSFLGSFGFSGERAFEPVASFSGGERARLVLALLIYQRPNVLLLDEPTNHLDLEMRFALARSLQDFSGAVLLVSHDRYLLRAVADTLLLVENGRVEQYPGDLDDYQKRSADRRPQVPDPGEGAGSGRRIQRRSSADRRERLRPLRNAVVRAEKQLHELHQRFAEIEQALIEPSLYEASSDPAQLKTLTLERVAVSRSLEQAEADWLASSEELELAEQEYASQRELGEPAWN